MKRSIFVVVLLLCIFSEIQGQKYYSKSKKAIKYFESAFYQYNLKNFEKAKNDLSIALSIDDKFLDAFILLGEIANEQGKKKEAIENYAKAINIDKNYNSLMYLRKADLQRETGQYADAIKDYKTFLTYEKKPKEYKSYVEEKITRCNFAIELMNRPVKFEPVNLGNAINTEISEYWPSLTADDSTIVFTSSNREINSQEDLYYSVKKNGVWQKAVKFGPPINSQGSEGAQTIAADGKTMVFTACLRSDGYGSCDLYISKKKGNKWSTPVNMGPKINGPSKESQPSLSANGNILYFVSNRPGGKGKFDIWRSCLNENNIWEAPDNLGDSINTPEDELAPFIHYDNKTIYFSSEGHLGMGGSDLFISHKKENGEWSKAKNLGYPINTFYNEESLVINAKGDLGLFSSNMEGGFGQKDIYQFSIPPEIKPQKVFFIKGLVYDKKTNKPLQAEIEISSLKDSSKLETESDEITGEFLTCLTLKNQFAFNVNKKGYLIFSENYFISDSNYFVKIPLEPIDIGVSSILKNIFFEYNSYELKKESIAELEQLKNFIIDNEITVEIQGHTDNEGTAAYNMQLSTNRAKSVYDYLIKSGIKKEKLRYHGYGYTKPIAKNDTETGRQKNRRTEFKIIAVKNKP